jgi:hypothetical protein
MRIWGDFLFVNEIRMRGDRTNGQTQTHHAPKVTNFPMRRGFSVNLCHLIRFPATRLKAAVLEVTGER